VGFIIGETNMNLANLDFLELEDSQNKPSSEKVAILSLNRPEALNAFNAEMIQDLQSAIDLIQKDREVRILIIKGNGRHFCAGADLKWMTHASTQQVVELQNFFESIEFLKIPKLALIRGQSFGGGVGLVSACDYAVCSDSAQFSLSEVRLGLLPAIIFPYLKNKMREGQLLRFAMSGAPFSAEQAMQAGLVQVVCKESKINDVIYDELEALLMGAPEAQAAILNLNYALKAANIKRDEDQLKLTRDALICSRESQTGQEGINSFFNKDRPAWIRKISKKKLL
jgi:methylglutaconyl-CoA hydratase